MRIRPYAAADRDAVAEICLRTADYGGDATGVLEDDGLWADVWALPYVSRHPDLAFVLEDEGRVIGYVVGTDDTDAFEEWFRVDWWPSRTEGRARPERERTRQEGILLYAYGRRPGAEPYAAAGYPAHLHIDLLPEAQGRGWGRRLIEALVAELRRRGVPGLHLTAATRNAGALAFYDRVGFSRLPSHEGVQAFGMRLG
ncbi:GNAT family N-acetyltransferase [Microbacterium sp. MEC084]|jgi:ribosomal protein S18 acetylase RimI-like enzyme|uniref:GNAT family N-acetyltransferase n=1 Tax=unclassified Microbacterium TaxID=2609290 RepID=UPI0006F9B482|nr:MULTISPECIES: GNAT family N-acetyltransferase [unclassified Microbacterium]KQY97092.1 acetyltransferase [Microbacterium sp. Root53]MCD1268300.1 GNAT family N-acetyltransferase [Microbacterium sp. MEC084]